MFRSSHTPIRALIRLAEDVLGDPPAPHPHRRPLRWERSRRPGSVPAAPAWCTCPVRGGVPYERVTQSKV